MHESVHNEVGDRYTLERELGRGGMATVWLARDLRHERLVAIKIMHQELVGAFGVDRFLREVRLTARVQHPNILPILDSGVLEGAKGSSLPWYAMPYLAGESLRSRLAREQQLPIEEALRITEELGHALQAAHRQGIVHRDIKPENVLLSEGRAYVLDFGIAKALLDTGSEQLTTTGVSIGTPAYMSPEQSAAGAVDARTDQYSLAAVLYEMLAGEPPFTGNTQAIMARRFTESVRPLRPVRPTVPEPVERAVLRALERVPADRFPDLAGFVAALSSTAPSGAIASLEPKARLGWRARATAGLLIIVALAAWLRYGADGAPALAATDPEAVALYQRGMRDYDRRTPAGINDAIAAFSAAVKRDSAYAPAWNGLAKSYVRAYGRGFTVAGVPRDSMLQLALSAVSRALAADSGSADVWTTQSQLSRLIDPTDNGPVLRSLRKAIALDSNDAHPWDFLALALAETGDFNGAVPAWRRSVSLDPTYTQGLAFLGLGHYWRRQYDSAAVWADSAIARDPNYLLGRSTAAYIAVERGDYDRAVAGFEAAVRLTTDVEALNSLAGAAFSEARAGRRSEARARLREVESRAKAYVPVQSHTAVYIAQAYAELGAADQALEWLERFQPRTSLHFQLHLRCDPPFDALAGDRRFPALLTRPRPPGGQGC